MVETTSREVVIRIPLPEHDERSKNIIEEIRRGTTAVGRVSLGIFEIDFSGNAELEETIHARAPINDDPVHLGIEARK